MQELHRQKSHIVFLQETHFKTKQVPALKSKRLHTAFHANNPDAKTKGVSILVAKDIPLTITDSKIDEKGRYIFLKGTLGSKTITLAKIYMLPMHNIAHLSEKLGIA